MKRSLLLGLNNFPAKTVPASLRDFTGAAVDHFDVNLRRLCHHLYLDTHGVSVPKPNPIYGLYQGLVTSSGELEFTAGSLGTHKEAKIAESMKLGKAFCRWFLYQHLGITYFAHMDHVLGKTSPPPFSQCQVIRVQKGDTPDYLCAPATRQAYLAEAKGRQTESIQFNKPIFQRFRNQFTRVNVLNQHGVKLTLKGYIVATRFRMSDDAKSVRSKLFAEDPTSPGEQDPTGEDMHALQRIAIQFHYSSVFEKLALPLQAAALQQGITLPEDSTVTVGLWKCMIPRWTGCCS